MYEVVDLGADMIETLVRRIGYGARIHSHRMKKTRPEAHMIRSAVSRLCVLSALLLSGPCWADGEITRVEIESSTAVSQPLDPIDWRGKPTVLYIWGDWCRACERSTPEVLALAARYPGARFVFVNTDDPARMLKDKASANVIEARVRRDFFGDQVMRKKGFRFSELGLVFGLPAYFVIDAAGRLAGSGNGSRYPATLDGLLQTHLAKAPATTGARTP